METKKRILVFVPEFPVLTETFILRELEKINEYEDIDLTVFSLKKGKGSIPDSLKEKTVYWRLNIADALSTLPYFLLHFSKLRKIFLKIKKGESSDSFYVFLKSVAYSRKFSKYKPQLLFAHFLSESSTIVMYASEILGIPYGISAHAKDVFVTSHCVREKIQTAQFIAVCNENAYKYLLEKFGNVNNKIHLIHHGIDIEKITKSVEDRDYKPEKPLILSVGRLVEKKGLQYLIDAAKILKDKKIDFLMEIIGFGPLYRDILEQIKENGLENEVKILGDNAGLPNEETLMHFKAAGVFAFPSIETEEKDVDGIANVLLEAGVFRVPVVASDTGSTHEIIIDGETGLLFSPGNSNALAEKLEILLNDEDLLKKLGNNLYSKVEKDFDINKNTVLLLATLRAQPVEG
jgi:glycosyltransferase involved in cell wall biosynthesis